MKSNRAAGLTKYVDEICACNVDGQGRRYRSRKKGKGRREWLANQANAQKSTGPRTRAGKRRASRNASQHGLSENNPVDPDHIKRGHNFFAISDIIATKTGDLKVRDSELEL
jgi:hypothetical protein